MAESLEPARHSKSSKSRRSVDTAGVVVLCSEIRQGFQTESTGLQQARKGVKLESGQQARRRVKSERGQVGETIEFERDIPDGEVLGAVRSSRKYSLRCKHTSQKRGRVRSETADIAETSFRECLGALGRSSPERYRFSSTTPEYNEYLAYVANPDRDAVTYAVTYGASPQPMGVGPRASPRPMRVGASPHPPGVESYNEHLIARYGRDLISQPDHPAFSRLTAASDVLNHDRVGDTAHREGPSTGLNNGAPTAQCATCHGKEARLTMENYSTRNTELRIHVAEKVLQLNPPIPPLQRPPPPILPVLF